MLKFIKIPFCLLLLIFSVAVFAMPSDDLPNSLNTPRSQRPEWIRENGIVMAGNWEPLLFRVRRDDSSNVDFNITPEQLRLYELEHSQEMIDQLKSIGVNFIMGYNYKAFGLEKEKQSMRDAADFAALCRNNGLNFGVYVFSGTLGWETLNKEVPESKDWELLRADGSPINYGRAAYRHYFNRNNPDVQAYLHKVMNFAMNDVKADLLHMDNYSTGPAFDKLSIERFRVFLKKYYKPQELNLINFDSVMPPSRNDLVPNPVLRMAWLDFSCQSLAESYYDMSKYARSINPDILVECNPGGVKSFIDVPADHGRMLRYGEAFWDEGGSPSYRNGRLSTRQVTYKIGLSMDNMVFIYIRNPLQAAESLVYNTDCLGCICQFEYGRISVPSGTQLNSDLDPTMMPYVRFFHEQRHYYRDAIRLPDVAVLRSFPSQLYCDQQARQATHRIEQLCIEKNIPWALIFDQHTAKLDGYKALSLIGADALSDKQINEIRTFVKNGGGLVLTADSGKYDDKLTTRIANPFADLKNSNVVRIGSEATNEEAAAAIKQACGNIKFSLDAPPYLIGEVTEQTKLGRRLVHLLNYSPSTPVELAKIEVDAPVNKIVKRVVIIRPESTLRKSIGFRQEQGKISFEVPNISVYALISIETE